MLASDALIAERAVGPSPIEKRAPYLEQPDGPPRALSELWPLAQHPAVQRLAAIVSICA